MAEVFSGVPGRFVDLADSIESFGQLIEGAGDDYPENGFYMVGGLKEALEKGREMQRKFEK